MLARGNLRGRRPAPRGMALITMIAQLRAVQVRVAGGAIVRGLLENRIDVALLTCHIGMHTVQAISRLCIVTKLGMLPDGRPRRRSVACLARNRQWAVGIARAFLWLRGKERRQTGEHWQDALH